MNTAPKQTRLGRTATRISLIAGLAVTLGACLTNAPEDPTAGLSFRADRFAQMEQLGSYQTCHDEAMMLDASARQRGSASAYLTSAKVMADCDRMLAEAGDLVAGEERMRLSALSIINYIRGGDVDQARVGLDGFKRSHPDQDLYFADGSSFIASVEALLGRTETMQYGAFSTLNVNAELKRELRRMHHWKTR
jgi:hypothetical protein